MQNKEQQIQASLIVFNLNWTENTSLSVSKCGKWEKKMYVWFSIAKRAGILAPTFCI